MIGERLEQIRVSNSLTKKELSRLLGMTEQAYNNYFKGKRSLPSDKAVLIKQLFNVSTDWLLTGDEEIGLSGSNTQGNLNCSLDIAAINIGVDEQPSYAKKVNNVESDMLDGYRSLLHRQKEYVFYKIKSMAFENENQTEA